MKAIYGKELKKIVLDAEIVGILGHPLGEADYSTSLNGAAMSTIIALGDKLPNMFYLCEQGNPYFDHLAQWREKYHAFTGEWPTEDCSPNYYEGVYMFKAAVEKAKSLKSDDLVKALEGMEFAGPTGKRKVRRDHFADMEYIAVPELVKPDRFPFKVPGRTIKIPYDKVKFTTAELVEMGKRGRGAGGKTPVFGLLKRGGRVYTMMIPNARSAALLPIMEHTIQPDSSVYTASFASYDALDVTNFHHVRVNHAGRFVEKQNHIKGIENFWNQAKRHLRRYNSIPEQSFYLFLKECEWRFNGGNHYDLFNNLKQLLKTQKRIVS
jgi:transposase-like protein